MDDKKKEKTIPSLLQKKFDLPTLPVYHSTAKHVFLFAQPPYKKM